MSITISVLMCIYNESEVWIDQSIKSILSQTLCNFELLIVVDNPKLSRNMREYLTKIESGDSRVIIRYNDENIGLAECLNMALSYARGEFIARMDADDISFPNRFQEELDFLISSKADVVSSLRINIDEDGNEISNGKRYSKDVRFVLPYENCICHPAVLAKTDVIRAVGGYRNFPVSQDYDLWLRIVDAGYSIKIVNRYLLKYRVRSKSISGDKGAVQFYTGKYQRILHEQRVAKGRDNFSIEDYERYLEKHHAYSKNKKYSLACNEMDISSKLRCSKNPKFVFYLLKAFFRFPDFVIYRIRGYIKVR